MSLCVKVEDFDLFDKLKPNMIIKETKDIEGFKETYYAFYKEDGFILGKYQSLKHDSFCVKLRPLEVNLLRYFREYNISYKAI